LGLLESESTSLTKTSLNADAPLDPREPQLQPSPRDVQRLLEIF
jgi:hypothetical protein